MVQKALQSWWDGNSTKMWRVLVIMILGSSMTLIGWVCGKVSSMPETYVTKAELYRTMDKMELTLRRMENDVVARTTETNAKVDRIFDLLLQNRAERQK